MQCLPCTLISDSQRLQGNLRSLLREAPDELALAEAIHGAEDFETSPQGLCKVGGPGDGFIAVIQRSGTYALYSSETRVKDVVLI